MNTTVQEWKKVKDLEVGMKIAVPRSGVFGMFSKTYENMAGPENEMAETGQEDVLWDEIVSIESVGVEQVFDIEVEGTHNFVAGHLIDSETGVQLEEKEEKEVLAGNDKNRKTWYGGIYAHNTYINGNVGIGTSVANTALEIGGSGNVRIGGLTISSGVYTDASKTLTSTPPTTGVIGYWSRTGTTLSPSVAGDDLVLPTGDWIGLSFTTARLVFNDTARDNLTITDGDLLFSADSAWNIGAIGATRPGNIYVGTSVVVGGTTTLTTDTLTGSGALNFTSQLALGQGTASAFNLTSSNDLGAADELIQIGDSAGTFLTVLGNGNVGIGTTNPLDVLSIGTAPTASATHALVNLSNTALSGGSANGTYIGANPAAFTGNFIDFQVGGARKFAVDYYGVVSIANNGAIRTIGATTLYLQNGNSGGATEYAVSIGGAYQYQSSGTWPLVSIVPTYQQSGTAGATDLLINRAEVSVGSGTQLLFDAQVGGTSKFAITNGGNVGIGTTNPFQKLHVEGHCITGDAELSIWNPKTNQIGKMRFDAVKGGEIVMSLDEKTGKLVPAKIKGLLDMGVKPIFKITTEDGREIRTTGNHPYLAKTSGLPGVVEKDDAEKNQQNDSHDDVRKKRIHRLVAPAVVNDNIADDENYTDYNVSDEQIIIHDDLVSGKNLSASPKAATASNNPAEKVSRLKSLPANPGTKIATKVEPKSSLEMSNKYSDIFSSWNFESFSIKDELSESDYNKNGDSLSNAKWIKVAELSAGREIAVANLTPNPSPYQGEGGEAGEVEFVRIAKIELLPAEQVWDIEVEGTHNFVANGIIAHNTYINGNVGIGTTNPNAAKLEVAGQVKITGGTPGANKVLTSDADGLATWETAAGGGATTALDNLASVAINTSLLPASDDAIDLGDNTHRWRDLYLGPASLHIGTLTSDEGIISYATSNNVLQLQSTGNLALQSTGGNVGIGTTNPTNKFSVYASSIPNYSSDQASGGTAIGGTDQLGKEKAKAFDNDSTTSWVASSGGPDWIGYDFGAGVSKTITRYTVQARYDDYLNFSMGDFTLQGSNTGAWGGEQVTLDTRAGIDWTSATQVQTFTLSNSTAYRYYRIYVTAPSSPGSWNVGAGEVEFMETSSYSSGSALEVTNLGNVGIGTTAPVYTLDVGGGSAGYDIRGYDVYTHDGAVTSFSDQRLKSVQGNFDRGLNEILALNPQYYHYKSSNPLGLASSETVVGVMAQDVQKLIPEAVQMSSSGYLTMSQGPIFYAMINAVKQQQGMIIQEQAKNTQQETAIADVNLKTSQNVETVQQLQNSVDQNLVVISNNLTTLSAGEAGLNSSVASLSAKQAAYDAQAADVESRLAAAEQKFKDDENNLATFETATNDTLSTMLQTENMLTERVLNHEERIKALEDKLATMTVSADGEIPANVLTQDAFGNATLAGVFKAKEVQTDGVVAGTMTIKNDKTSDAPTMGDGEIISVKVDADKDGWDDVTKVDGKSARVKTDAISETAKIFVTFEGDPGSRYWVEKIKDADGKLTNSFSINVSDPVKKDVKFSWWIVESK